MGSQPVTLLDAINGPPVRRSPRPWPPAGRWKGQPTHQPEMTEPVTTKNIDPETDGVPDSQVLLALAGMTNGTERRAMWRAAADSAAENRTAFSAP